MLGVLDAFVKHLGAAEKPMIYVRGNHEVRGQFAERMAYFFDLPLLDPTVPMQEQNYYFTIQAGPVYFLMMDVGDEHGNWKAYQQRQADWLEGIIKEADYQNALWRVGYWHIPLYTGRKRLGQPRDLWESVTTRVNLDLTISGHTHRPRFYDKGTEIVITEVTRVKKQTIENKVEIKSPYPSLIGDANNRATATVLLLSADKEQLSARMVFLEGETQTFTWDQNRQLTRSTEGSSSPAE